MTEKISDMKCPHPMLELTPHEIWLRQHGIKDEKCCNHPEKTATRDVIISTSGFFGRLMLCEDCWTELHEMIFQWAGK